MKIHSEFPEVVAELGGGWRRNAPPNLDELRGIALTVDDRKRMILPGDYPSRGIKKWIAGGEMRRLVLRADGDFRKRHDLGRVVTGHLLRFRSDENRGNLDARPHTDISGREARSQTPTSKYWIASGHDPADPDAPPATTKFYEGDFVHLPRIPLLEVRALEQFFMKRQCRDKPSWQPPEDTLVVSDAAVVHAGPGPVDFPNIVLRDDVRVLGP
jgi:hypothetical protein